MCVPLPRAECQRKLNIPCGWWKEFCNSIIWKKLNEAFNGKNKIKIGLIINLELSQLINTCIHASSGFFATMNIAWPLPLPSGCHS